MARSHLNPDEQGQVLQAVADFMEALSAIRPLTTDVGDAYLWGEDISGADVGYLQSVVALRDDLVGLQRYLRVCGIDVPVPSILVARGDMAEIELGERNEPRLDRTPTRPRKAPDLRPSRERQRPFVEAGP